MKAIQSFIFLAFLLVSSVCIYQVKQCTQLSFLPMPKQIQCALNNPTPYNITSPCNILYTIKKSQVKADYGHFVELIQHQQYKAFGCHLAHIVIGENEGKAIKDFSYNVSISVVDPVLKSVFTTKQEKYEAIIGVGQTSLKSDTYVGFVRALQTFIQSITCHKVKKNNCYMTNLPISIQDEPAFTYRAVMIDTARHFQPINIIYETIDALMYNKMSIMHWHIVDEDSFPLKLDSHPEIAQFGAFSDEQIYTTTQVKEIVRYGLVRGVRIIPQLDTPGHAASWGKSPKNKELACTFGNNGYMGPIDVTLHRTYELLSDVFAEIFTLFPDPLVHLGGDEVVLTCLTNKTEFAKAENIQEHQIEMAYRKKQRKMLKELNSTKKFIYWMNSGIKLEQGDIVHWWGAGLPQTNLEVIISQYGPFYIDMGVGNYYGVNYGVYTTWLDMYNLNIGRMVQNYANKAKVLGAQVTLWSEISNQYTHHLKIWIRSSSLAERTWTTANYNSKPDFFRRITAHERSMHRRGIPTAPATCQQCETNPQFC